MLCAAIANAYGCKVDEGSVHPCIINGHDYGELLYSLGVMGWFMLVTIPGGLVAFVSWLIFLILHRVAWRKRMSAGIPPQILPPPCNSMRICALQIFASLALACIPMGYATAEDRRANTAATTKVPADTAATTEGK